MSDAGSKPDSAALVRGWLEHSPFASFLEVDVEDADGEAVAKGLVTYRVFSNG